MPRAAWMLAPLLLIAPLASAEIYKCALKDGVMRLQNFPCAIDRLDSLPSSSASATAPMNIPAQDKKETVPAAGQPTAAKPAASSDAPRIGMTADEVRAAWGEPSDIYWDELVDGRKEVWSFGGSRQVQFDVKGRASAIQR